jgi:hypothetical protein
VPHYRDLPVAVPGLDLEEPDEFSAIMNEGDPPPPPTHVTVILTPTPTGTDIGLRRHVESEMGRLVTGACLA